MGLPRFCNLLFSHRNISVYEDFWSLMMFHNWSWNDLMDLIPWEFDSFISLTAGYLEMQEMKAKQQANKQ